MLALKKDYTRSSMQHFLEGKNEEDILLSTACRPVSWIVTEDFRIYIYIYCIIIYVFTFVLFYVFDFKVRISFVKLKKDFISLVAFCSVHRILLVAGLDLLRLVSKIVSIPLLHLGPTIQYRDSMSQVLYPYRFTMVLCGLLWVCQKDVLPTQRWLSRFFPALVGNTHHQHQPFVVGW